MAYVPKGKLSGEDTLDMLARKQNLENRRIARAKPRTALQAPTVIGAAPAASGGGGTTIVQSSLSRIFMLMGA